jgi:energy-converting hydrogenase Eha subunit F
MARESPPVLSPSELSMPVSRFEASDGVMSTSGFQPLLPDDRAAAPLLERAAELVAEGDRLESSAGTLASTLTPLLRSMNSYYSNKIEGKQTRPADIERALAKQSASQAAEVLGV